ncbi:unnamed protein product [Angiostrongylus costaricensis]|uniref:Uncharacterized protein n=1 Tax=Angiostrongylus costaricensis TaxID=334426 RepID=A0A0R3PKK1_ANGCS|nr:unnamed protein product [Angiostrongylus costaricensis]
MSKAKVGSKKGLQWSDEGTPPSIRVQQCCRVAPFCGNSVCTVRPVLSESLLEVECSPPVGASRSLTSIGSIPEIDDVEQGSTTHVSVP